MAWLLGEEMTTAFTLQESEMTSTATGPRPAEATASNGGDGGVGSASSYP